MIAINNFFWNDDNTIIYTTVDKQQYFLQGLNAILFSDLASSSILLKQLPNEEIERAKLIDNLAIALATIDRQFSEPASISFLQALWLKEKRTGFKRFIDLLSQRQWKDSNWEGYRDHLNHMLKVYLTGLYVFKNCRNFREMLLSGSDDNKFLRKWLYASTFHDIGYIFE